MLKKLFAVSLILIFCLTAFASQNQIRLPSQITVGEDQSELNPWFGLSDNNAPPVVNITDELIEETFGEWGSSWSGLQYHRGNIFLVNSAVNLHEHRLHLDAASTQEMCFFVYMGSALTGTYNLVDSVTIPNLGPGNQFYSSGVRDFELTQGYYYFIGIAWSGTCTYARGGPSPPTPCSFGSHQTGVAGNLSTPAWPVQPTINNTYSTFQAYHQTIVTGYSARPEAPQAPENFTVTHNQARLQASLAWTNPDSTFGGAPLTDLDGVKVFRGADSLTTLTNVQIGQQSTYEDNTVPAAGFYEYCVIAFNDSGDSPPTYAEAWIGLDTPGEPGNVTAEPDTGGALACALNWTAPTQSGHGGYWPGTWDGQIIFRNGMTVDTLLGTNTTFTDNPVAPGWYSYGVGYFNASGTGPVGAATPDPVYVGTILSGSYDIGGGQNHFQTIVEAVNAMSGIGIGGPTTFNVYPGTYDGQVTLHADSIPGVSATNTLAFVGVHGPTDQMPVVTNSIGTSSTNGFGFNLTAIDYVTVKGFEVTNCQYGGIRLYINSADSCTNCTIEGNYIHGVGPTANRYALYPYRTAECDILGNELDGDYYGIYGYYCRGNLYANNMLYGHDNYGLRVYRGSENKVFYNSVFTVPTSTSSYTFYCYYSNNRVVKNNIFYNTGSGANHRAYYLSGDLASYPLISDYNDIFAPDGTVGYYNGAHASLAAFQAATGMDSNSISVDPAFLSMVIPYDLHLEDTSLCMEAGTPLTDITTDFDGELRNPMYPCIGCDEVIGGGLRLTLNPVNPPIQIPAGGGFFHFDAQIENREQNPITFDAWTEVVLPNGAVFGPLILRTNLPVAPGQTISRTGIMQNVPGNAPPGTYSYVGKVGIHPNIVIDSEEFPFSKMAGEAAPNHNQGWAVYGWFGDETALSSTPTKYELSAAYPNPFNPTAKISFALPEAGHVMLTVFDITGREVATLVDGMLPLGRHEVVFDGEGLSSGVYFYKMTAKGFSDTRKMVLVK